MEDEWGSEAFSSPAESMLACSLLNASSLNSVSMCIQYLGIVVVDTVCCSYIPL